ncbi:MAG: hypothetical protein QW484_01440 [Candidatus Pacearchaeota archaeon]
MIKIKEEFRRDGLAANFLADGKLIKYFLEAFPNSNVNIGYPSICKKEYEACKEILEYNKDYSGGHLFVAGHACKDHLDVMSELIKPYNNASAGIWIPISERFNQATIKKNYEELKKYVKDLVNYWYSKNTKNLTIALADCTANEYGLIEKIVDFVESNCDSGLSKIIICDSLGIGTPDQINFLFSKLQKYSSLLEFHPHNDNGFALQNIEIALKYGIRDISTSVYNSGERKSMVDPRDLVYLGLAYDKKAFEKFEKYYKEIIGDPSTVLKDVFGENIIVTGTQYRLRNLDPKLIKKFGVTSDREIAKHIFNKNISAEELKELKNKLYINKKIIIEKATDLER